MRTVPVAVAFAVLALAVACVGIAQLMRALHGAENSTPYESPATFWNDVRPATRPGSDAAGAEGKTPVPVQSAHNKPRPV
jgi:DMSO/TMAO reductase YedYZ molybdopterin-dependent catalytic subunit